MSALRRLSPASGLPLISISTLPTFPLGIRQRLSLAVAIVHKPEILILDEPTSGVDPLARDAFWDLLADLSRNDGYDDLHLDTFHERGCPLRSYRIDERGTRSSRWEHPAELIKARRSSNLEDAFISYLEEANETRASGQGSTDAPVQAESGAARSQYPRTHENLVQPAPSLSPMQSAKDWNSCEDPIRMGFALLGTAISHGGLRGLAFRRT